MKSIEKLGDRLRCTFRSAGLPEAHADQVLRGSPEGLPQERSLALVGFDADNIQQTVLRSPRPQTILGASDAIRAWDTREVDRHIPPNATKLYSGGGTATFLVPRGSAEEMERIARALEAGYERQTHGWATVAWLPLSPRELVDGQRFAENSPLALLLPRVPKPGEIRGFGACMANLAFCLRVAKGRPRDADRLAALDRPRCVECASRPRTAEGERCEACESARRRGQERIKSERAPRSFDDLVERGQHLAFVCIDGSGIGRHLERCRTIAEYCELSSRLHEAFEADLRKEFGEKVYVALQGGDDLLFVMPAEGDRDRSAPRVDVFAATNRILSFIEQRFEGTAWSIGAGAGIVITRNLPADYGFEVARRLCKNAKSAIAEDDPNARSAIDFEVILGGSPLAEDIERLREAGSRAWTLRDGSTRRVRLTQRPYPLGRFQELLRRATLVKRLPRAQVMGLRRMLLDTSADLVNLNLQYQLARQTRPDLAEALGVTSLGGRIDEVSEWLLRTWVSGGTARWATALPDLIEVSGLLGSGETGADER